MAASSDRMTKAVYLAKQMCLEDLKNDYILKLENFLIDVETSMRSQNKDRANENFETAVDFLTQPFPDVKNIRAKPSTTYWGATSALGSLIGSPRSVCERRNFHAKGLGESRTPGIEDVLLVSERLMLQSVYSNKSVKLFTEQGDHLHSLEVNGSPLRLALIDSGPGNTWKVAVTFPSDRRIALLEVTPDSVTQLTSIQTSGLCYAIKAIDTATLAVGYYCVPGIDLIDMTGRVLRRLSQSLHTRYMTVTQDGCLFMSTRDNKVAKVRIQDSQIIFNKTVPEIEKPAGVATLQDGWFVVSELKTRSLHLVTPDGRWDRQLWRHPRGSRSKNWLWGVSVSGGVCVAVTCNGETYVFDIS